jgi:hypothetical protein
MKPMSILGAFFQMLLIFVPAVMAAAQMPAREVPALPPRGSRTYLLVVDELADYTIHFASAKRFVQLHGRSLTERQCQQYWQIADDYADQLAAVKQAGASTQSEFWNDVREHSIGMIGPPGVPIPVHQASNYWMTTGSEAEDRELRRIVSLEIDEANSQLIRAGEYSPLALNLGCRNAGEERTATDQP